MQIKRASCVVSLFAATAVASGAEQVHRADSDGIESWETKAHGVTVSLTQILPDQARAFYINRGFAAQTIEPYATACVYMTVLRNDNAPGAVHFRLPDWSVVSATGSAPPLATARWLEQLEQAGASKSSLIAFRWAQFPPEQSYQPGGDWNQGMLTTGLPAGGRFDLVVRWDVDGEPYQGVVRNVRCAE